MASTSGGRGDDGRPPQMQPVRSLSRRMTRAGTMMIDHPNEDESAIDSELVPSSLSSIAPVLRVANDIEEDNPRVAYLCMMSQLFFFIISHSFDTLEGGFYCRLLFGFEYFNLSSNNSELLDYIGSASDL